jgi:hypothetical protein
VRAAKRIATTITAGMITATLTKYLNRMFLAGTNGGRSFAFRVIPGLIVVALAAWAGALGVLISG